MKKYCCGCGNKLPEQILPLNSLLSDEYLLYTKLYNYHWNVTGPLFQQLHDMFKTQYEALNAHIDVLAERIRAIGGQPVGSLAGFLNLSSLEEGNGNLPAKEMVKDLYADHKVVSGKINSMFKLTSQLGDDGTADLLLSIQHDHDKFAWMLRSILGVK
jgi:starvation-inducible DNA-binding protein